MRAFFATTCDGCGLLIGRGSYRSTPPGRSRERSYHEECAVPEASARRLSPGVSPDAVMRHASIVRAMAAIPRDVDFAGPAAIPPPSASKG